MEAISSKLKQLMSKKDSIEKEMQFFTEILKSQKNVGMTGSLLDEEHFPRSDINIYAVKEARCKIDCLSNDHKSLMKEIETNLSELHKINSANVVQATNATNVDKTTNATHIDTSRHVEPFASIGRVDSNSPADIGGLRTGDQIIEFGSINKTNFTGVADIARVTKYNQGQVLNLTVKRVSRVMNLSLVPNTWSGPGMLGCMIVPISK